MNRNNVRIDVVEAFLPLVLVACPLGAAEFRPVAVWTDAECYSNPPVGLMTSASMCRKMDCAATDLPVEMRDDEKIDDITIYPVTAYEPSEELP
jgi:hypothetical protein